MLSRLMYNTLNLINQLKPKKKQKTKNYYTTILPTFSHIEVN